MVFPTKLLVPVALVALIVTALVVVAKAESRAPAKENVPKKYGTRYTNCRTIQNLDTKPWKGTFKDARICRKNIDFHKVLLFGANRWGVSYDWLHACVHAEGGHGPAMIWNRSGSSAYGMGQFMPGTYTRMAENAYQALRINGKRLSRSMFFNPLYPNGRPDTPHGQALAMSLAFSQGRSVEWAAAPC